MLIAIDRIGIVYVSEIEWAILLSIKMGKTGLAVQWIEKCPRLDATCAKVVHQLVGVWAEQDGAKWNILRTGFNGEKCDMRHLC